MKPFTSLVVAGIHLPFVCSVNLQCGFGMYQQPGAAAILETQPQQDEDRMRWEGRPGWTLAGQSRDAKMASLLTRKGDELERPPVFCNLVLLVYGPLLVLGVLIFAFSFKRQQAAQSFAPLLRGKGTCRGSLLVVEQGGSVQQNGLQRSFIGQSLYMVSMAYLVFLHALLVILAATAIGVDYHSRSMASIGSVLLAVPGGTSVKYSWDALAVGFILTFVPCLLLTLSHAIGSISWRLRLLLPCSLTDAELISVTRDVGSVGTHMPDQEVAINRFIHKAVSDIFSAFGADRNKIVEIARVQHTLDHERFIVLRGVQYTFVKEAGIFTAMQTQPNPRIGDLRRRITCGLSEGEVHERMVLFGLNKIDVPVPTAFGAIWQEVSSCGYLYQLFFLYQWFFLGSFKNGTIWGIVFIFSALSKAFIMRSNMIVLRDVAVASGQKSFKVIRGGTEVIVPSYNLLPGDIILFQESGVMLPADCFLLEGNLLLDESVVTGEATPVQKFPLPNEENKVVCARQDKKNYLFAGTSVLQGDPVCKAVVLNTGVSTSRGQLLNTSLYPNPLWIKFDEDYKVLFVYTLIFGIIAGALIIYFNTTVPGIFQAGFAVWNTFSPLLPVALAMGQSKAATRLRSTHGILCLTPARTAVAGRVDTALFDKTGTLTEDGLEMVGVVPEGSDAHQTVDQLFNPDDWGHVGSNPKAIGLRLVMGMAHNIAIHGSNLVGSSVEAAMLHRSGARSGTSEGQIRSASWADGMRAEAVEKFPFNHNTMTMSVVVNCAIPVALGASTREGRRFALVKGAPEKVEKLCGQSQNTQDPGVDPNSLDSRQNLGVQQLAAANRALSRQGCYVLMAAYKLLPDESNEIPSRAMIEKSGTLHPLGLLVFRNPIRPESLQLIQDLRASATPCVMVSGDSHLTAAAIARETSILSAAKVLTADIDTKSQRVQWLDLDSGSPGDPMADDDAELVVSGEAWGKMFGDTPWLPRARVFGRTSPEQKIEIVEAFIRLGRTAMFVGDGGNDCGALRAAHVGVALTQQKLQEGSGNGSVIAHFNTTEKTPYAAFQVLREGRCALASSLSTFLFLFGFGLQITGIKGFMFGSHSLVHYSGVSLIILEGVLLPCAITAMVHSGPRDGLDQIRPSWSLLNTEGVLGMVGPLALVMCLLSFVWFYMLTSDWYTPWDRKASGASAHGYLSWGDNFEMEVIFFVFFSALAAQSFSFSLGGRFRAPVWTNLPLMIIVATVYCVILTLTWTQQNAWTCGFRINCNQNALDDINSKTSFLQWVEVFPGEARKWMSNVPEGNIMPHMLQVVITAVAAGGLVIFVLFQKIIMESIQQL